MSLKNLIDNASSLHVKLESAAAPASYATNTVGFTWGAVTFNEWVMAITLILGLLTFIVNFYYKREKNKMDRADEKRKQELHKIEIEKLRKR